MIPTKPFGSKTTLAVYHVDSLKPLSDPDGGKNRKRKPRDRRHKPDRPRSSKRHAEVESGRKSVATVELRFSGPKSNGNQTQTDLTFGFGFSLVLYILAVTDLLERSFTVLH